MPCNLSNNLNRTPVGQAQRMTCESGSRSLTIVILGPVPRIQCQQPTMCPLKDGFPHSRESRGKGNNKGTKVIQVQGTLKDSHFSPDTLAQRCLPNAWCAQRSTSRLAFSSTLRLPSATAARRSISGCVRAGTAPSTRLICRSPTSRIEIKPDRPGRIIECSEYRHHRAFRKTSAISGATVSRPACVSCSASSPGRVGSSGAVQRDSLVTDQQPQQ